MGRAISHYIHARSGLCFLNPDFLRSLKMPPIKDEDRYLLKPVLGAKRDRALLYTPDDQDELVQPSKRRRFTTSTDHHEQVQAVAVSESVSPPSDLPEDPIQRAINQDDSLCYSVDDDDSESLVGLDILDVESLLDTKSLSVVDMGLAETEKNEETEEIELATEEAEEEVPRNVVSVVESNLGMNNDIDEEVQEDPEEIEVAAEAEVLRSVVSDVESNLGMNNDSDEEVQEETEEIEVAAEKTEVVVEEELPRNVVSNVESNLGMNNNIDEEVLEVPFVPPPPISSPPHQLRRSPRLANRLQVPSALPALRRSPRLALKPRVSYVGMC
jgi:hypothetical protein